jgi:hypothetical protein
MNTFKMVAAWMLTLLLAGPSTSVAAESEQRYLGIVTGDSKGTAHQVGMDVKALLKRNNIHLAVFNSSGSVENIYAVYQRPGNHLGLVQSDVLSFVAKVRTDNQLKLIANKIRWVFPLYDQEIHVLTNAQINDFGDLHDKRVAIGHLESDTYLTSRLLFEIAGVTPRQIRAIDHATALAALKAGRIDAMIIVDGVPIERLAMDVSVADNLKLIPLTLEAIRAFYPASRIPAGTYPWQAVDVDTVSVKAVMVAYDFRNHHCRTIGMAAWLIRENLDWLRFNGHPKWRTVDLDATVKGWERYQCVANVSPYPIDAELEPSRTRRPNPVADAIEAVFEP